MNQVQWGGRWLLLLLTIWGAPALRAQSASDTTFLSTLGELRDADYSAKSAIVDRLSQSGHPSLRAVLTALMSGRLYFRNSDQQIFLVKSADSDPLQLIDPLTLKDAGSAPADSLTNIGTNNSLRRVLRTTVARFALSSPVAADRLQAVRDILASPDDETAAMLRERSAVETNASVKKEIATGLALASLGSSDSKTRLDAIA